VCVENLKFELTFICVCILHYEPLLNTADLPAHICIIKLLLLNCNDSLQNIEDSSCFSMLQNVLAFCLNIGTSTSMAKPNTGMDSILLSFVTCMYLYHTGSDYILSLFFRVATVSKISPYWLPALLRCIF